MKHMKHISIILFNILIGIISASSEAQESSLLSQVPAQQVEISLPEAIRLALENNFDIRIAQYEPKIVQENIQAAEAAFDLALSAGSSYTMNESDNTNTADDITSLNVGVERKFKTGGSYTFNVQTNVSAFSDENAEDSSSTGLTLTLSQSLLKGRGREVNTIPIVTAQKQLENSSSDLRSQVITTISDVQNAYWDLVQARGVLEADQYSLQLAYDLVKSNEAQVKVGLLAPIEVLQAQATAASREVQIISDEQEVLNTEDTLRQLLNVAEDNPLWEAELIPTTMPDLAQQVISLEDSIQLALEAREELQRLRTSLEIQELSLMKAQNDLLPELTLQGSIGLTGDDESWSGSVGNLADANTYLMSVGLTFSYPIGNAAAKSEYYQNQLELDQARLSQLNTEQQIIIQVKQAVRAVETAYQQIKATDVAGQLAEQQLNAEQKKFDEGLSTNFTVLDYQEKLASARSDYTKAIVSYYRALVSLDQATGTTLQHHEIVVEE